MRIVLVLIVLLVLHGFDLAEASLEQKNVLTKRDEDKADVVSSDEEPTTKSTPTPSNDTETTHWVEGATTSSPNETDTTHWVEDATTSLPNETDTTHWVEDATSTTTTTTTVSTHPLSKDDTLEIKVEPSAILPGLTEDLTVTCSVDLTSHSLYQALVSLVILRRNSSTSNQDYEVLVGVDGFSPATQQVNVYNDLGSSHYGSVDRSGKSFVTMEWTMPNPELIDTYYCEANLYMYNGHTEFKMVAVDVSLSDLNVEVLQEVVVQLQKEVHSLAENQGNCSGAENQTDTEFLNEILLENQEQNETLVYQAEMIDRLEEMVQNLTQIVSDSNDKFNEFVESQETEQDGGDNIDVEKLARVLFHDTHLTAGKMTVYISYNTFFEFDEAQGACKALGGWLVELEQNELVNLSEQYRDIFPYYTGNSYIGVHRDGVDGNWTFNSDQRPANFSMIDNFANYGDCLAFDLYSGQVTTISCDHGFVKALCLAPNFASGGSENVNGTTQLPGYETTLLPMDGNTDFPSNDSTDAPIMIG